MRKAETHTLRISKGEVKNEKEFYHTQIKKNLLFFIPRWMDLSLFVTNHDIKNGTNLAEKCVKSNIKFWSEFYDESKISAIRFGYLTKSKVKIVN